MSKVRREGPFRVITTDAHSSSLHPDETPRRQFSCSNYETCLSVAAALNWDNFTCRGCDRKIDEHLLWQARNAKRLDKVASSLCELPETRVLEALHPQTTSPKVVAK